MKVMVYEMPDFKVMGFSWVKVEVVEAGRGWN